MDTNMQNITTKNKFGILADCIIDDDDENSDPPALNNRKAQLPLTLRVLKT